MTKNSTWPGGPGSRRAQFFTKKLSCLIILLVQALGVYAQTSVSGTVFDENNAPLPGVNVLVRSTTSGTTTDAAGKYTIRVPDESAVLTFTFIGYQPREILVGTQTLIDVTMSPDVMALEEIVVVGYGTERKSDLTGAVSLVNVQEMNKLAASDLTQMLQGRVAGVAVNSDGQPGATPSVKIRGIASFGTNGTNTEPLYVVDGVPLLGGIRDFNPHDIESVQILKDASAGAIYGSRAANGVIIITTKRGAKEKPLTIDFSGYSGVQQVADKIPVTGRVDYQLLNNEMRANNATGPLPPLPGNDPDSPDFISDVDTDWQEEGFKTGYINDYTANFSGGSASSTYNVSLNYFNNSGTLVGNGPNYNRYTARINSDMEKGILKFGESLYLMHADEDPLYLLPELAGGRPSYVNDLVLATPTMPVYDPSRKGGFGGTDAVIQNSISLNVPGINTLVTNETKVNRMFANVYAELSLLKKSTTSLSYRLNLGYDYTVAKDHRFVPEYDLGYFFPNANARSSSGIREYSNALVLYNEMRMERTVDDKLDPRFHSTILAYEPDEGYTMSYLEPWPYAEGDFFIKKYTNADLGKPDENGFNSGINYNVVRLADVYLMYAECQNELNNRALAAEYIQKVRDRANLPDREAEFSGYSLEQMRDQIAHERVMELAIEGTRIYDIIRWGWLQDSEKLDMLKSHDPEFNNYVPGSEYLKIPQGELDLNENLKPNSAN